jgi:hypothetical protein
MSRAARNLTLLEHRAKQHAKDQGGEITHEYSLIKGFAYVLTTTTTLQDSS